MTRVVPTSKSLATKASILLARFVPWAAAVIVAVPVLVWRYPPMFDLPNHVEIVAAMRHFHDASRYPPGLLVWNLGHPNQLFYFIAWAASLALPVETACKLVVAGSVAAIPIAAMRLADHLGTSRWAAVAVAPLGLGFAFYFGFVGNLLAYGIAIAALPFLDALARDPNPARALGGIAILVTLYAAHESALIVGCLALVVLSAGRPFTIRGTAWRALPLVTSAALVAFEQVRAVRAMGPTLRDLPPVIDLSFEQKLSGAPQALLGLFGSSATRLPFLLILVSALLPAVDRVRLRVRAVVADPAPATLRAWIGEFRFELLGIALVVAYFEVPFSVQGAMWLHARFLAPGLAVLAVSLAPRAVGPNPPRFAIVARFTAIASIGAVLAMVRPAFAATSDVMVALDPLLAKIEPASAVAHVDLVGGPLKNIVLSVGAASARASTEQGGRVAVSFLQTSPIPPVVIAPEHRWDDALERMAGDGTGLRPAFDLQRFGYVIAFVPDDAFAQLVRAMAPEARPLARSGNWALFESTLPRSSILAREPARDDSESLRARLERGR